jgi:hypothetical protein
MLVVFSAAPLAPNATRQARRTVGATKERTLFAVACTRLFGSGSAETWLFPTAAWL